MTRTEYATTRFWQRAQSFLRAQDPLASVLSIDPTAGSWHPTGFAVFHTQQIFDGRPTRLHIWPAGARLMMPNHPRYHSHEWDLAGLVLAGRYDEEIIEASADEAGESVLYEVNYRSIDDASIHESTVRVRTRGGPLHLYKPGEIHYLAAKDFHAAFPAPGALTATLVVTGDKANDCQLLGDPGYRALSTLRARVDPRFVEDLVSHLS